MKDDNFNLIPSGITISRVVLAFIFLYLLLSDQLVLSIFIFIIAVFTDVLDGYLARKFESTSSFGAYLDIFADFFLVYIAFVAFVFSGIYPYWLLILIFLIFLQFLITSKFRILVYDPIGKYYGAFLFIIILITLISPDIIYGFLLAIILIFTLVSLISRYFFFIIKNKR